MLLALAGTALLAAAEATKTIDVTEFGASPDSGEDATPGFKRAIAAVKAHKGPVTLIVPRGTYDFFPRHATRRVCFYSNATEADSDGMRTIALDLSDTRGLTVQGNGARLVMRGLMTMLVAERSVDLRLTDLEFDFARPTVSEIQAVEVGEGYWIGRVHEDSAYRLIGNRILWTGEDWSSGHDLVQHYAPSSQTVWRGSDPTASATSVTDEGNRLLRFEVPADSLEKVFTGWTYQFRDTRRSETGMWFDRCRSVSLKNVQIRAMAGFGVLFQSTESVDVQRLEVAPRRGGGRTCASAADHRHFSGCRGRIRVKDSVLTAAHDDAINIHGTHLRVVSRTGNRQVRVRFMHAQTWGFAAFAPGDGIDFVRRDTLQPFGRAKVRRLRMTDDPREQILDLDRDVPSDLILGWDVVENVTWTPSVEITGCQIAQIPTRGILVTTRRPIRIVGNEFLGTTMPAILVEDDAGGWYESGAVRDLLIQGNTFFECGRAPIEINPRNSVACGPVHRNVRILANDFTLSFSTAISVKSTAGLTIQQNLFRLTDRADVVETNETTGLIFRDNIFRLNRRGY